MKKWTDKLIRLLGGVPRDEAIQGNPSGNPQGEVSPNSDHLQHSFRKIEKPPIESATEDMATPRYPPYMEGLPSVAPKIVLNMQNDLAREIIKLCDTESQLPGLAERTLSRYAEAVHLLPASESDHHAQAGGLYRHGLEVAKHALLALNSYTPFARDEYAERRRHLEPRMRFAVLTASLCHDIGKPLTDVNITNAEGNHRWNPLAESIYEWAINNNHDRYFLHWNYGRHKRHEPASIIMMERVAGKEGLSFVNDPGVELLNDLTEAVSGEANPLNIVARVVKEADKTSTERDKKRAGGNGFSTGAGIPVDKLYLDTMRQLIRTKKWEVNKPGNRVWVIQGHVFVLWPAGGDDIAGDMRQKGVKGVPYEPLSISRELLDRSVIVPRMLKDQRVSEIWPITPEPLKGVLNSPLNAIRIANADLLFDSLPKSVDGEIGEQPGLNSQAVESKLNAGVTSATTKPQDANTQPVQGAPAPEQSQPAAFDTAHASNPILQPEPPKPHIPVDAPPKSGMTYGAASSAPTFVGSEKEAEKNFLEHGLAGVVCVELARDLNNGKINHEWVRSNKDTERYRIEGLKIMLKAPDAFLAYHANEAQLRDEMKKAKIFSKNEDGGLDMEVNNQIWWQLEADATTWFIKLTQRFTERQRSIKKTGGDAKEGASRGKPKPDTGMTYTTPKSGANSSSPQTKVTSPSSSERTATGLTYSSPPTVSSPQRAPDMNDLASVTSPPGKRTEGESNKKPVMPPKPQPQSQPNRDQGGGNPRSQSSETGSAVSRREPESGRGSVNNASGEPKNQLRTQNSESSPPLGTDPEIKDDSRVTIQDDAAPSVVDAGVHVSSADTGVERALGATASIKAGVAVNRTEVMGESAANPECLDTTTTGQQGMTETMQDKPPQPESPPDPVNQEVPSERPKPIMSANAEDTTPVTAQPVNDEGRMQSTAVKAPPSDPQEILRLFDEAYARLGGESRVQMRLLIKSVRDVDGVMMRRVDAERWATARDMAVETVKGEMFLVIKTENQA